jgi:hypothetical protein
MPFGRWKGVILADLGDDYLLWLSDWPELREPLKTHVFKELETRDLIRTNIEAAKLDIALIEMARRQLARQFHPDIGGSDMGMKAINAMADYLLERVSG